MRVTAYTHALEMTKIILETNPESLIQGSQIPQTVRAERLAEFINTLAEQLDIIMTKTETNRPD
ncbi:hypothetical protein [Eikenella exigua]|uniref:hypothetical protein n=1 Tax=Eikenella exigua TaxID=2528037 RepID=UPI00129B28A7|nr:hypothetical protein [Eikenella exigua]